VPRQPEIFVRLILASVALIFLMAAPDQAEERCGWLSNSATGKWDLYDTRGAWQIMFLGGDSSQAEGMDKIPDLTLGEYVRTFATKGYGCACMDADTDDDAITRIHSVRQLPLSRCRTDPAIQYFLQKD
jgi:hypothetical protein